MVDATQGQTTWTPEQLERIGRAEELDLASSKDDGSLRAYVTMWVVRSGDDLYVRSAAGPERSWYRRATASGRGRIRAGGVERNVTFASVTNAAQGSIDAAYHAKYHRYASIVDHVVGPDAHKVTIRLVPHGDRVWPSGAPLYFDACGFAPTSAGLLRVTSPSSS